MNNGTCLDIAGWGMTKSKSAEFRYEMVLSESCTEHPNVASMNRELGNYVKPTYSVHEDLNGLAQAAATPPAPYNTFMQAPRARPGFLTP